MRHDGGLFFISAAAHEHDVGLLQAFEMLPIIVQHGIVERVDASEVIGIEHMLCPNAV
jgi:hypothetical protein